MLPSRFAELLFLFLSLFFLIGHSLPDPLQTLQGKGHSSTQNGTDCNLCIEGQYSPIDECSLLCTDAGSCPPGYCLPCQAGSVSSQQGATKCVECEPGHYQSQEGQTSCLPCSQGTHAPGNGTANCLQCANGTIASEQGATMCQTCKGGTTSDQSHKICYSCPPGTHCPGNGCPSCSECLPGTYQNRAGQEECPPCNYGTYSHNAGSAECTPCGTGRYLDWRGASKFSDCIICPVGSYCPDPATEFPIRCPENAYCPQGSSQPVYCGNLFQPNTIDLKCQPSPLLYVLIVLSCLITCGIVVLVIYNRRSARYDEKLREEASHILSKENQGPVYSGL